MRITLTTTGRHSGKQRSVALYGYEDGDAIVIVGSNGGKMRDPGWANNLRADPRATVKRGKTEHHVKAAEAKGKRRERAWELAASEFPLYRRYQERTDRQIPVFILQPVKSRAGK